MVVRKSVSLLGWVLAIAACGGDSTTTTDAPRVETTVTVDAVEAMCDEAIDEERGVPEGPDWDADHVAR